MPDNRERKQEHNHIGDDIRHANPSPVGEKVNASGREGKLPSGFEWVARCQRSYHTSECVSNDDGADNIGNDPVPLLLGEDAEIRSQNRDLW